MKKNAVYLYHRVSSDGQIISKKEVVIAQRKILKALCKRYKLKLIQNTVKRSNERMRMNGETKV